MNRNSSAVGAYSVHEPCRLRALTLSLVLGVTMYAGTASAAGDASPTGEELYFQNCVLCHGDDGTGAMASVPDLTQRDSWRRLKEDDMVARLMAGIETPGANMAMPPAGGNPDLTAAEVRQAFRYLRDVLLKPE